MDNITQKLTNITVYNSDNEILYSNEIYSMLTVQIAHNIIPAIDFDTSYMVIECGEGDSRLVEIPNWINSQQNIETIKAIQNNKALEFSSWKPVKISETISFKFALFATGILSGLWLGGAL